MIFPSVKAPDFITHWDISVSQDEYPVLKLDTYNPLTLEYGSYEYNLSEITEDMKVHDLLDSNGNDSSHIHNLSIYLPKIAVLISILNRLIDTWNIGLRDMQALYMNSTTTDNGESVVKLVYEIERKFSIKISLPSSVPEGMSMRKLFSPISKICCSDSGSLEVCTALSSFLYSEENGLYSNALSLLSGVSAEMFRKLLQDTVAAMNSLKSRIDTDNSSFIVRFIHRNDAKAYRMIKNTNAVLSFPQRS